jgi:hypothetical protein
VGEDAEIAMHNGVTPLIFAAGIGSGGSMAVAVLQ